MFKEKLGLDIIGKVAFKMDNGATIRYKNSIQATAKQIVSLAIIQNAQALIDTIELYLVGVLVSSRPITARSIVNSTEVQFDCLFDGPSFTGPIDEARLKASALGYFSIVTGVSVTKTSTASLLVSWTIQIV